ncbi:GntR family transcriptional regulator [Ramlibacter sp. AW1]|uniref:GntR family transcriptional regulator n=1 Tax=Ramlibacter aurantiacus TaxID=2801330 RepID=A0A936ZMZ1_9BURK|nr:GntR family transcriptional regulator [Ramlibacter aurantiacus]MBL0422717.1 GntR family transcriptional regulator [Ramlibacter aurantiacus]
MKLQPTRAAAPSRPEAFAPFTLAATAEDGDTTQNRAYRALRNAVLAGHFHPGTTVTLARLSEMLGTSDMPVREALKRLTAEGAFEALPNRSTRVPVLSARAVKQILELRIELEGRAAAEAAEHVSKRHLEQLIALDAAMSQALDSRELGRYVQLNMEFHFTIYRLADNEPLLALIEALWLRMAPLVAFNLTRAENVKDIQLDAAGRAHHARIIQALKSLDGARACEALRADLRHPSGLKHYFDGAG